VLFRSFDVADEAGKRRYSLEPVALELDDKRLSSELVEKVKEYQAEKVKAFSSENAALKANLEAAETELAELKATNAELIAIVEAL
jgi:predicted nuclease with TOPRIM domain